MNAIPFVFWSTFIPTILEWHTREDWERVVRGYCGIGGFDQNRAVEPTTKPDT